MHQVLFSMVNKYGIIHKCVTADALPLMRVHACHHRGATVVGFPWVHSCLCVTMGVFGGGGGCYCEYITTIRVLKYYPNTVR